MCYTRYNEHQDSAFPQFMLLNVIFTALNIQNPPSVIRGQTVQEKGGAEVSWFPLSVSVNVRKCSVV